MEQSSDDEPIYSRFDTVITPSIFRDRNSTYRISDIAGFEVRSKNEFEFSPFFWPDRPDYRSIALLRLGILAVAVILFFVYPPAVLLAVVLYAAFSFQIAYNLNLRLRPSGSARVYLGRLTDTERHPLRMHSTEQSNCPASTKFNDSTPNNRNA